MRLAFRSAAAMLVVAALVVPSLSLADEPAQPSPEQMQKMMEIWKQVSTPGAEHALLAKMAGEWTTSSKVTMGPGMEPQISTGSSKAEMALGNRFLEFEEHGSMMGSPFEGHGAMGYDNYKKKFWMSWYDDMGTALYTAEGTASADGRMITFLGKMDEPTMDVKGKDVKYVVRWVDDSTRVFEIYDEVGTPKEFMPVEITYTKKK